MPDHRIVRTLADLRPGDYIEHPVIGGMKVASNWQAEYEEQVKAEHEPTPSDQALRDLRAGVEALREEWLDEPPTSVILHAQAAVRLMHLLASSAPATASEGVEGTTELGRNSSASEGATEDGGLHQKYRVERIGDTTGKHADCWYFVLDPKHDPRARLALRLYAHFARTTGGEDGQRLWGDIQGQLRDLCLRQNLCFNCLDAVKGHRGECSFVLDRTDLRAPGVASSDGERDGLRAQVRSAERAAGRWARENEDAQEISVALAEVASYLAGRAAQPESTERVEWGVQWAEGGIESCPNREWAEDRADAKPDRTLLRRTVTTYAPVVGPWEPVEDTTGGDHCG
jgi:hypothetical protein